MLACCRRLPAVSPLTCNNVHLVVFRAAYNVGRNFCIGGGGREETTATDAAPVLIPANTVAIVEWCNDAWELDADIGTILVSGTVCAMASLPFIRAVQVDVEFLSSMEEVTARETDFRLRTITAVGATDGIAFDIEIVRLVEYAVQAQVEGVGVRTWGELKVSRREYPSGVNLAGRLQIVVIAEHLAGPEFQVLEDDTWTDRRLLAIEIDCQMPSADAVCELFARRFAELHIDVTDIPFPECFTGQVVCKLKA